MKDLEPTKKIVKKRKKPSISVAGGAADTRRGKRYGMNIGVSAFSDPYDDIILENKATERMDAVINSAKEVSVIEGGPLSQLSVPIEPKGLVKFMEKSKVVAMIGDLLSKTPERLRDLEIAKHEPTLFWNIVYHTGGREVVKEHDCSVAKCARLLHPNGEWTFLDKRARRK